MQTTRILPDDLPVLRDFAEQTFRRAWQGMTDPAEFEAYCTYAFTPEKLGAELADPQSEFYFVREGDTPVAYLKINLDQTPEELSPDPAVQIERIYVRHDYQGRRIGERLLGLADERARATGARWLWLSVWQEAPRSVEFYRRNGFEVCGVTTFWDGFAPSEDWIMKRAVQSFINTD
jgi:ribosomal protein S18 acetylase RimI-like enzyme